MKCPNLVKKAGTSICISLEKGRTVGISYRPSQFLLPPSAFLGLVSPYAIRLQTRCLNTAGSTAGNLYSLSTVGSISGTLVTSFYLIAAAGVKSIIFCVGLLLLVSAVPLLSNKDRICLEGR